MAETADPTTPRRHGARWLLALALLLATLLSAAAPSPALAADMTLTLETIGDGTIGRTPAGTGDGPFAYPDGTTVTLTPHPDADQGFVAWVVDDVYNGWADPLTITMDANHTVKALFAPKNAFDVAPSHPAYTAIVELATRGIIRGYNANQFGADHPVQRAQMAALISRGTPAGPGTPPTTLTPPACLVVGSWDCEDWGNTFTDQSGDPNLWRNAGTMQHYGVALGYTANDCAAKGKAFPCYGPNDPVSHAQTIAFITRGMIAKGYWVAQPNAPLPHQGVPEVLAAEVRTFHFYTGGVPAAPTTASGWNGQATRGWFAMAAWAAGASYWGVDSTLPDGRPAGGYVE